MSTPSLADVMMKFLKCSESKSRIYLDHLMILVRESDIILQSSYYRENLFSDVIEVPSGSSMNSKSGCSRHFHLVMVPLPLRIGQKLEMKIRRLSLT